jgi:hypothetical protein
LWVDVGEGFVSIMARPLNLLSPKFVETVAEPGKYSDGGGLYLQVSPSTDGVTKSWLFRYMRGGKISREMGLGATSMRKGDGYTTLNQARQKRTRAREMLEGGHVPYKRNALLGLPPGYRPPRA